jgi:hypothetical protein
LGSVCVVYCESGKELKLETVKEFTSNDVMLVGCDDTNYTCEYIDNYNFIVNIRSEQSFSIDGGVLKYGASNWTSASMCYFIIVNGTNSLVNLRYVNIIFMRRMNSLLFVEGGSIIIEYMKIENQTTNWVYTLIYVQSFSFPVKVEFFSLNITNCNYKHDITCAFCGSALVTFHRSFALLNPAFLNLTDLFFLHNTFDVNGGNLENYGGAFFFFTDVFNSGLLYCCFCYIFF